MMDKIEVTPNGVMEVYRYGQRRGFIAGVIFCIAVKYLTESRHTSIKTVPDDIRTRN